MKCANNFYKHTGRKLSIVLDCFRYVEMVKCNQKAPLKLNMFICTCVSGVGGNSIAMAPYCDMIWAVDIDENKSKMLRWVALSRNHRHLQ